jgi:hypothetical protein
LNKSHGAPPVRQHIGICMTGSRREVLSAAHWEVLSFKF